MEKKITFLILSSISLTNFAMDSHDSVTRAKENSTIPVRHVMCCRQGSAVPVCDRCYDQIVLANMLIVEKKALREPKKVLSLSQERRLP